MNKIGLIFKREYLTRVRNKTFLLSTFLLPIVFIGFIFGATFLAIKGSSNYKIAVYDPTHYFKGFLKNSKSVSFDFVGSTDTANYEAKKYNGLVVIPPGWNGTGTLHYDIRSSRQLGSGAVGTIEDKMNDAIEDKVLQKEGITSAMLDSLRGSAPKAEKQEKAVNSNGEKVISSGLSKGVGLASGILIYMMMFIYGAMTMRGVMEEKTSRIAEVIISSVKPFQLMMGKILGIGAVGLTQFLLWILLIFGLAALAQLLIPHDTLMEVQRLQTAGVPGAMSNINVSENARDIYEFKQSMATANWPLIISCFLFYFLGGYLFYAALFASVGCMVNEDPQEAQSLMLPITMPIIFGFIIMQATIQNPDSSLAFWGSMIPFTSPIVMMARIPSEPPAWQIILSMVLLVAGFIGTGWMAGKIYRTGILMYGKKGTWKQMMRWVFAKS